MYDLTCKRCGAPIMEYRGAWFSRGDENLCEWGKNDYHYPDPVALLRKRIEATAGAVSREDAQRVLDEIYARRPIKEAGTCK